VEHVLSQFNPFRKETFRFCSSRTWSRQLNAVYGITYFCNIHFSIIIQPRKKCSTSLLYKTFLHQNSVRYFTVVFWVTTLRVLVRGDHRTRGDHRFGELSIFHLQGYVNGTDKMLCWFMTFLLYNLSGLLYLIMLTTVWQEYKSQNLTVLFITLTAVCTLLNNALTRAEVSRWGTDWKGLVRKRWRIIKLSVWDTHTIAAACPQQQPANFHRYVNTLLMTS
jgi:hypothetical protein